MTRPSAAWIGALHVVGLMCCVAFTALVVLGLACRTAPTNKKGTANARSTQSIRQGKDHQEIVATSETRPARRERKAEDPSASKHGPGARGLRAVRPDLDPKAVSAIEDLALSIARLERDAAQLSYNLGQVAARMAAQERVVEVRERERLQQIHNEGDVRRPARAGRGGGEDDPTREEVMPVDPLTPSFPPGPPETEAPCLSGGPFVPTRLSTGHLDLRALDDAPPARYVLDLSEGATRGVVYRAIRESTGRLEMRVMGPPLSLRIGLQPDSPLLAAVSERRLREDRVLTKAERMTAAMALACDPDERAVAGSVIGPPSDDGIVARCVRGDR